MVSRRTRRWPHGCLSRLDRDFPRHALPAYLVRTRDDCEFATSLGLSFLAARRPQAGHFSRRRWVADSWTIIRPARAHFGRSCVALHARRLATPDDAWLSLHAVLSQRLRRKSVPRLARQRGPLRQLPHGHHVWSRFPRAREGRAAWCRGISGHRCGRKISANTSHRRREENRALGRLLRRISDGHGPCPQL